MYIRRFKEEDAEIVSKLVGRNLLEVNIKDYPKEDMIEFANYYNPETIKKVASEGHMYIACENEEIIGCGAVTALNGEKESIIVTFFILPEYHGKGVGKTLLQELEKDEIFLRAGRVQVDASLGSHIFYKKMGYEYRGGIENSCDGEHYEMEKFNR